MKTHRKPFSFAYVLLALLVLFLIFKVYTASQRDNVMDAVVRYHLASASPSSVIFLSVDKDELSNNFIGRFNSSKTLVRKESQGIQMQSRTVGAWGVYSVDRSTGRKGQSLIIGSVSWQGPFRVQVEVVHPGFGERLTVALTSHGWVVTGKEGSWII